MNFRRELKILFFGLLLAWTALAQGSKNAPEFEVATVRVGSGDFRSALDGPTEVTCVCNLSDLLVEIFHVPYRQIQVPAWDRQVAYEIHAKLPEGTTKAGIPEMLRRLLEERLHLVVREEFREVPGYSLEVDTKGLKAKPAGPDPPHLYFGRLPFFAYLGPAGRIFFEGRMTFEKLASLLTPDMGRPVVDHTNRPGEFEIHFDASLPNAEVSSVVPDRIPLPDGREIAGTAPPIFSEIQKLGLRLVSGKLPVKYVVVESVDRNPTDN
jgi:uncharacterized protein (TIGR03435 family)